MTDASLPTADAEPLVSFRQSEWDTYQRYVAGLEAKIAGHDAAEKHRVEKEAAEAKRAEARAVAAAPATTTATVEAAAPVYRSSGGGGGGRTAMFVIGWILFSLGVGIPTVIQAFSIPAVLGFVAQGHLWVGIIVGVAFLLSIISLFMQIGFQRGDRPLAVLLNGILAPLVIFALTVITIIFTSFAVSSSMAEDMETRDQPSVSVPVAEAGPPVTLRLTGAEGGTVSFTSGSESVSGATLPHEAEIFPTGRDPLSYGAAVVLKVQDGITCEWLVDGAVVDTQGADVDRCVYEPVP